MNESAIATKAFTRKCNVSCGVIRLNNKIKNESRSKRDERVIIESAYG